MLNIPLINEYSGRKRKDKSVFETQVEKRAVKVFAAQVKAKFPDKQRWATSLVQRLHQEIIAGNITVDFKSQTVDYDRTLEYLSGQSSDHGLTSSTYHATRTRHIPTYGVGD